MSDYYMIDGQQVPRVTHVIRSVLVAPALQAWRERRVAELACEGGRTPERVLAEIRSDRTAMERGSQVHRWIAEALDGKAATEVPTPYVLAWASWYREHRTWEVLTIEQLVTTAQLRAAGTLDAVFDTPTGLVLVDWKTTGHAPDRPWISHVAQLGAYVSMPFTWTDEGRVVYRFKHPTSAAVVYLTPDGYQTCDVNLGKAVQLWERVLGVYEIAVHLETNGQKGKEMSPLKSAGKVPPARNYTERPDLKGWLGKVVILEPIRERTIETRFDPTTEVTDCLAWSWNEKTEEVEEIGEVGVFWRAIRTQLHDAIAQRDQVVGILKLNGKRMELEPVPETVLEQIAPKFF